jgi:hypothetical protein
MLPPVKPPSSYRVGRHTQPSLRWLAMNAGLALRVQGVELLLEALLGALSPENRAPHQRHGGLALLPVPGHAAPPLAPSLKKRNPLQCVPVTARATALSEG